MGNGTARRRRATEEAGKPRPPSRPASKPSDLISSKVIRLANILRRSSTFAYRRELGLAQVEWRIVALVGEHSPVSLTALSDLMGLDRGQTSRGVSALVRRRLVLREYREKGRGIDIRLTRRGAQVYGQLLASALERNRRLLAGIPEAERPQFIATLDRLTGLARKILADEREEEIPPA